jgi:hypothetical protein
MVVEAEQELPFDAVERVAPSRSLMTSLVEGSLFRSTQQAPQNGSQ